MIIYYLILINLLFSFPKQYQYQSIDSSPSNNSLPSNGIIDFVPLNNEIVYVGTGSGLGKITIDSDNVLSFKSVNSSILPKGGNPAVEIRNGIIAISGVTSFFSDITGTYEPQGTGIGYSLDEGISWKYMPQPIMEIPFDGLYDTILWGGQNLEVLAVTTDIQNVSYDLGIMDQFIYSTSWAGGLRRFDFSADDPKWEIIPLPMDNQDSLFCGMINSDIYELNPKDPKDGGNNNHKAFSINIIDDQVWVGTANGINVGELFDDSCIDWIERYSIADGLSGNWIIDIKEQNLNERIWAITWATGQSEKTSISFSDDKGESWDYVKFFAESSIKVYNLSFEGFFIFASTIDGLYVSNDGEYWELYPKIIDSFTGEQILSDEVYDSYINSFDKINFYHQNNQVWLGTNDGLGIYNLDGSMEVKRFWKHVENPQISNFNFSAYPNPFMIKEHNINQGQGHVRFIFYYNKNRSLVLDSNIKIQIYDFAMDHVVELNNPNIVGDFSEGEIIWDGRNNNGDIVANGVYFCKLITKEDSFWTKLVVVN